MKTISIILVSLAAVEANKLEAESTSTGPQEYTFSKDLCGPWRLRNNDQCDPSCMGDNSNDQVGCSWSWPIEDSAKHNSADAACRCNQRPFFFAKWEQPDSKCDGCEADETCHLSWDFYNKSPAWIEKKFRCKGPLVESESDEAELTYEMWLQEEAERIRLEEEATAAAEAAAAADAAAEAESERIRQEEEAKEAAEDAAEAAAEAESERIRQEEEAKEEAAEAAEEAAEAEAEAAAAAAAEAAAAAAAAEAELEGVCENTDTGVTDGVAWAITDDYDTGCDWYANNLSYCGTDDTASFHALEMCCACAEDKAQTDAFYAVCEDNMSGEDVFGDDCSEYHDNTNWCGKYDQAGFSAWDDCCACKFVAEFDDDMADWINGEDNDGSYDWGDN